MRSWRRERGEGRMGCVVSLAMAGLFLLVSFQAVPAYIAKVDFQESLDRVVSRSGATGKSARFLAKEVERIADFHDLNIVPDSLRSEHKASITGPPQLRVEVACYRDLEFPGFTYRFQFTSKASTFIGSF